MKKLEDMTLEELWQLFPIILTEPNPNWSDWALQEITYLHNMLGKLLSRINHIGSTAIKGIWAKPIIDLLLETDAITNFHCIQSKLLNAGYICMNKSETRLDFNKGYTPRGFADKVFHIHVRLSGDNDEIYFRDYLNAHSSVAKDYERLKLSLWRSFEHNRDGYTNAKSDFITHYTTIAKHAPI